MSAVRVFYGKDSYDAFIEQERQARLARLIEERKSALARMKSVSRPVHLRVVPPSSEETCQRIADIVSGEDVRQQQAQARRFARSVRLVGGGSPGLGKR